jgi:hypothetical protein
MSKRNILFIGGSLNQTKMMHAVSRHFENHNTYFTYYYADGFLKYLSNKGMLDFTPLGGRHKEMTLKYFKENNIQLDIGGKKNVYDLIFTCSDLVVQKNIKGRKIILVQEGMTDPENIFYYLVKYFRLPRWSASTSTTGMSDSYSFFCVASEGYKKLFIKKGINPGKIIVTGIPNFDNIKENLVNNFPYENFVLVATSDSRETFKYENRKKFISYCCKIAGRRQLIFKLHPNENFKRAANEINKYAPGALIFYDGNINHMIAKCDTLITRYSTVVYIGLALGKTVYSYFDINQLKELLPIQNNGTSAHNIAQAGLKLLNEKEFYEVNRDLQPAVTVG